MTEGKQPTRYVVERQAACRWQVIDTKGRTRVARLLAEYSLRRDARRLADSLNTGKTKPLERKPTMRLETYRSQAGRLFTQAVHDASHGHPDRARQRRREALDLLDQGALLLSAELDAMKKLREQINEAELSRPCRRSGA